MAHRTIVNVLEARNTLSRLIRAAAAGEDVVIANRGVPVVRLVPVDAPPESAGIAAWLTENRLPAHARRSDEEIERSLREERDSWD